MRGSRSDFKKVAVVTGGSRGIGRSIVLALASEGYRIAFTYRQDLSAARSLQRQLAHRHISVLAQQHDAGDNAAVRPFIERIVNSFGRIDVVVNNAGITFDRPLALMKENEWDAVIRTNLKSVYNMCHACLPQMIRQHFGRIINIASTAGLHGVAGQTNYCASKGGVISFSKALAREVARFGITVNVVAPGYIKTEMLRNISTEKMKEIEAQIPLGRCGRPEEVAQLVSFLVEKADYLTGQTIVLDGGMVT